MKKISASRRHQRHEDIVVFSACLLALALAAVWIFMGNVMPEVTDYYLDADLDEPLVIVQLSDLHGSSFGRNQEKLAKAVEEAEPDVIVITGDIVDRVKGGLDAAEAAVRRMAALAPVYFVTGNHERDLIFEDADFEEELYGRLEEAGAVVLNGDSVTLRDGVTLTGVPDLSMTGGEKRYSNYLSNLRPGSGFNILLVHRPEYAADYAAAGYDLAITGHAHGGQVRLPVIGGVFSSGQGFLPKWTAGLYGEDGMAMLVSRGLGNSEYTFRINNNPEIVVLTVK